MSDITYTTDNGIEVKISEAPFETAGKLKTVIINELKNTNINFGSIIQEMLTKTGEEISALNPNTLDAISKTIISVAGSEAVEKYLFAVLIKSTYDGCKITQNTFDNIDARKEYFKIIAYCIKLNILPFFANLGALLILLAE